jgi:hypothetical protein
LADRISKQPTIGEIYRMITLTQEFLILKTLIREYDDALKNNNALVMMEISVDIAESAEKLEQASVDHANKS